MSDATASPSSFSSTRCTLKKVIVCGSLQLITPLQAQKAEHEIQTEEQLQRVVEQGCDDEQPHLIVLSTDSEDGNTSMGREIGSNLLVSAFIDHP